MVAAERCVGTHEGTLEKLQGMPDLVWCERAQQSVKSRHVQQLPPPKETTRRSISERQLNGALRSASPRVLPSATWNFTIMASADIHPGATLTAADLEHVDLRGINLRGCTITGSLDKRDLRGADLRGATLRGVSFVEANLSQAVLRCADLEGCKFERATMQYADLSHANCRGASFRAARLEFASLVKIVGALPHLWLYDQPLWVEDSGGTVRVVKNDSELPRFDQRGPELDGAAPRDAKWVATGWSEVEREKYIESVCCAAFNEEKADAHIKAHMEASGGFGVCRDMVIDFTFANVRAANLRQADLTFACFADSSVMDSIGDRAYAGGASFINAYVGLQIIDSPMTPPPPPPSPASARPAAPHGSAPAARARGARRRR